jgi:hypothetical protein
MGPAVVAIFITVCIAAMFCTWAMAKHLVLQQ